MANYSDGLELRIPEKIKGTTFTPHVDSTGLLTWTNDNYEKNPDPVNIKGPEGKQGIQGRQGIQGIQGENGKDGVSPTFATKATSMGAEITITDVNGTHTVTLQNGGQGVPGVAGKGFDATNKLLYIGGVVNATPKKGNILTLSTKDFNRTPIAEERIGLDTYSDAYETASSIICSIVSVNEMETNVEVMEAVSGGLSKSQIQDMIDDTIAEIPKLETATW